VVLVVLGDFAHLRACGSLLGSCGRNCLTTLPHCLEYEAVEEKIMHIKILK